MSNNILKKFTIIGITTMLIAGCAPTRQEVLSGYQRNCYDYGFAYGSDAFANCMIEQEKMSLKQDRHYTKLNHHTYVAPVSPYYTPPSTHHAKVKAKRTNIHQHVSVNNNIGHPNTAANSNIAILQNDLNRIERETQERRAKADAEFTRRTDELRRQNEENLRKMRELAAKEEIDNKKRLQIENDAALAAKLQAEEIAKEQKRLENERKEQQKQAEELRIASEKRLQEVEAQAKADKEIHERQIEQMAIQADARKAMHEELKAKVAEREARLNGETQLAD